MAYNPYQHLSTTGYGGGGYGGNWAGAQGRSNQPWYAQTPQNQQRAYTQQGMGGPGGTGGSSYGGQSIGGYGGQGGSRGYPVSPQRSRGGGYRPGGGGVGGMMGSSTMGGMPWQRDQHREYMKYGPGGAPQAPDFMTLMQNMPQMQQAMTMMGYGPEEAQSLMAGYLKNPFAKFLGAGSGFGLDKTAFLGSQGMGGPGLFGG